MKGDPDAESTTGRRGERAPAPGKDPGLGRGRATCV